MVGVNFVQPKDAPANGFDSILHILHLLLCKISNNCQQLLDSLQSWKGFFQEKNMFEKASVGFIIIESTITMIVILVDYWIVASQT